MKLSFWVFVIFQNHKTVPKDHLLEVVTGVSTPLNLLMELKEGEGNREQTARGQNQRLTGVREESVQPVPMDLQRMGRFFTTRGIDSFEEERGS